MTASRGDETAAVQECDKIEIEHIGRGQCFVKYEEPRRKAPDDLSTQRNNLIDKTLSEDSLDDKHNADASIGSHEGEDQCLVFDSLTSLCVTDCVARFGYPRKSAMKKPSNYLGPEIRPSRSVSFNSVTVREHDVTLGDHPSSASGPPIQLDWKLKNESTVDLDRYEENRQPRRKRKQLKMSFQEREEILQSSGFTVDQLKDAWMESLKVRQQRYETLMMGNLTTKMEEAWESACRKFNRMFALSEDEKGFEVKSTSSRNEWAYVSTDADDAQTPDSWSFLDCGPSPRRRSSWTMFPSSRISL
jgi:hypothetical protein